MANTLNCLLLAGKLGEERLIAVEIGCWNDFATLSAKIEQNVHSLSNTGYGKVCLTT
jgi:hypothetical protein